MVFRPQRPERMKADQKYNGLSVVLAYRLCYTENAFGATHPNRNIRIPSGTVRSAERGVSILRIALFTEVYLPYINGVVTHVKILKEGLEKLGHSVLVVTSDPNTRHHYTEDGVLHCPAVRLKKIYNYGLASPFSHTRTKLVEDFRPDVIHIHTEFSMGLLGIHIAHKLKVPLVYTLHTMYDDYVYYVAPKHLARLARDASRRYARHFAREAQALTSPSEKGSVYFREAGITKKVNVIPNAVELDSFRVKNIDPQRIEKLRRQLDLDRTA